MRSDIIEKNKNIITLAVITIIAILVFVIFILCINGKNKTNCIDLSNKIEDVLSKYGELKHNDNSESYVVESDDEIIEITFKRGWLGLSWYKIAWYKYNI